MLRLILLAADFARLRHRRRATSTALAAVLVPVLVGVALLTCQLCWLTTLFVVAKSL
jgi:hypothetical protein